MGGGGDGGAGGGCCSTVTYGWMAALRRRPARAGGSQAKVEKGLTCKGRILLTPSRSCKLRGSCKLRRSCKLRGSSSNSSPIRVESDSPGRAPQARRGAGRPPSRLSMEGMDGPKKTLLLLATCTYRWAGGRAGGGSSAAACYSRFGLGDELDSSLLEKEKP